MFVCDDCMDKKYTNYKGKHRSYGPCEICNYLAPCVDTPSFMLVKKTQPKENNNANS